MGSLVIGKHQQLKGKTCRQRETNEFDFELDPKPNRRSIVLERYRPITAGEFVNQRLKD